MAILKHISRIEGDDDTLIQSYKRSNDPAIAGALYERYMELVYGVCLKYLKSPEDAQDSVIAIYEELLSKLKKHEIENFRPWLYTLAKNHCLMRLRSEKKHRTVDFDTAFVQSEDNWHLDNALEKEASFEKLEGCLNELTSEQRLVIELFYLKGKCYKEIAETSGIEWNRVRSFIQNGRRNLRICMERQPEQNILNNDAVVKK